jgi:hypothetical protein
MFGLAANAAGAAINAASKTIVPLNELAISRYSSKSFCRT